MWRYGAIMVAPSLLVFFNNQNQNPKGTMQQHHQSCSCRSDTESSDSTVTAEQEIEALLNDRDLYIANTKHEKRLLRCVRDLSDFVAKRQGVIESEIFWNQFRRWAIDNTELVNGYANSFMSNYLKTKGHQSSAFHTVRLYIQIWKTWGINISDRMKQHIQRLEREQWQPKKVSRLNKLQQVKTTQFEVLEPKWKEMVRYMLTMSPEEFRQHLESVANNRRVHASVATSSFNEMAVIANKSDKELKEILLGTLAYSSLLRYTGMRSITGANVRFEDFMEQADGGLLLRRIEKKCGSVRNVEKVVYVLIVPHKDPQLCTLVHLATYFNSVRQNPTCRVEPFARGFNRKSGQDPVNFCKMVQRRYIAVLHAVAIACGMQDGLGGKRLHIFRVICENVLGGLGVTSKERQEYIGWAHDTQAQNYSLMKHRALNSTAPYLMSGRQNKDDSPHSMWSFWVKIPNASTISYWERVHYLATAAGFVQSGVDIAIDTGFQKELEQHMINANKAQQKSDPKLLLQRVRELERELQDAKRKVARVEIKQKGNPKELLEALVSKLKERKHGDDFPQVCADHFPEIARLIDAGDGAQNSFCLKQSTAAGKDLIRILLLGSIAPSKPNRGSYQNWFSFVNGERKRLPMLRQIDTSTWNTFKATTQE